MPKTHVIYNQIGAFVGPAPSSGYHFISSDGALSNNPASFNLVFPLNRVTSASFSFETQRTSISNLGDLSSLKRPILNHTDVNLNISYSMMGLANEARIGMHMNIPSGDPLTGQFGYGSGRVSPILGFYSRNFERTTNLTGFNWPYKEYRDARNIFFAIKKDTLDLNIDTGNLADVSDYHEDVYSMCFGDCYLNSYGFNAGVRTIPNATLNYTCNNISVYDTTTGNPTPSISTQTQLVNSGIVFNIPSTFQGTGLPTVLLPRDISLTIKQRSNDSLDLSDSLVDFTDIKVQNFSFGFNLNRRPLYSVGHKYPLDRQVVFPVLCDVSFDCLEGDPKVGQLSSLLKRDEDYDVQIKMAYQVGNQYFSGTAIQYDWVGAKFQNFDSNVSIQGRKSCTFGFSTEMNPLDTTNGFFISGYLSLLSTFITNENLLTNTFPDYITDLLLTEDSDQFLLASPDTKPIF